MGATPAATQDLGLVAPPEVQAADLAPVKARVNLVVVRNHLAPTVRTAVVRIMLR